MLKKTTSDAILGVFHLYRLAMRSKLKASEIDLNAMHVKCLTYIADHEPCTANDIVNYLQRDKAQIARLIKEMISRGWLIKDPHPEDKRSQVLRLTQAGKDLAALILSSQQEVHKKMQESLTHQDLQEFNRIADVMTRNLRELHEDAV